MDLARLKSLLPSPVSGQLDVLWRRFAARHRDGDVNDFVAALHADGLIDAELLRELLASPDVTLTISEAGPRASSSFPNRHRLLGLLGKGAMGEVYIGRDPDLRRNVAIKRMDARLANNPVLVSRFAHEAQITAQLDHPAIIPVYGLDPQPDGTLAYSMKLIRGRTLKQVIAEARGLAERGGKLPPELALPARLDIFLQVCNALSHAHSRGVIHRDLKPDNIMVGAFQEVIVMDWGIARLIGGTELVGDAEVSNGRAERTQLGLAIGTPRYMSPEQAQGRNDELDARSDQYALGLILSELVTLKVARSGKRAAEVLKKAIEGQRDPLVPVHPSVPVPRELGAIVRKATAFDPARRYRDVAELADDVRRYLRDEAVLAEPDTLRQRLARWVSHHRNVALSVGSGLVMLVLLTAALGVLAAVGVREVVQAASRERETRTAAVVAAASAQSRRMEASLLRYEGLLQGLATTAETRLAEPQPRRPFYLAEWFTIPGKAPPDLSPSTFYDGRVSLEAPDVALAPGVKAEAVADRISQLVSLTPVFADVHRRAADGVPDWQTRLRNTGVPIVWSYAATKEGILVGYPGSGVYPADYDPREQEWYQATVGKFEPHWQHATVDESGMGLLVTCTRGLRGPDGEMVGVAAVDITVGYLIDTFLVPQGLAAPVEAWLVDGDGRVVVRSSLRDAARTVQSWQPPPFGEPDVLAAVRAAPEGGQMQVGSTLWVWTALPTLGWTYLLSGDADALVGG